ncbi:hybrid sensor histidine kinase/response regulator transcription factor [Pedobacter jeongneungensis]|uniref:hybrid sensor histidine kinase/response regulator transcription factor n=1 Tax=Pedobacter jeongneungensis TaxID=947309 RepID=UPI000468CEDB|nr:hybrid sensor histidine kinase/response regulator transcription factor [Pedobacter jeongneungensis]
MKLTIAIFLFYIGCFSAAYSQRIAFENLTVDNGLSQNSVLAIVQDGRGFMWYGTQHGLNKYNARSFKIYKNDPSDRTSLSSNYITCLLLDSHKVLWVGTRNGLNKYNPETDSFERVLLDSSSSNKGNQIISSVYEDRQKNIWVWSSTGLYLLPGGKSGEFSSMAVPDSVAGLYGTNVHVIYQDHEGIYWIGSSAGLTKMKKEGSGYRYQIYRHQAAKLNSLSDNYVTTITEDLQHNLWIGTLHGGINLYDKSTNTCTRFLSNNGAKGPVNNNIRILKTASSGKIWIGTQGGLSILDPKTMQFSSYKHDPEDKSSLSQNSIYSVFIDNANTVWIGTYFGGINMVSGYNTSFLNFQTTRYHSNINNNVVSGVREDNKHNLWIGTEGVGLNYFDREADVVTTYQNKAGDPTSLGSDLIKVVYIDKSGNIWAGTHGGGLNVFNPKTHNFKRYLYNENDPVTLGSEVLDILEDSRNNFWVGTQNGLLVFRRNNSALEMADNPVINKIGKQSVKILLEDKEKNIWMGTSNGLFLLDHTHNDLKQFTTHSGLKSNDINCIFQDTRGRIWVGLYYGGLAAYNNNQQRFVSYSEKQGLANNNVQSILEDANHNLWMGTGNGLSKFNIASQAFKNYYKSDGLLGNTFNINSCYKTFEGEMLFGGYNGLSSFYPSKIEDNNIAPPVVITELKLFNQPVRINQPYGLLKKDISLTPKIIFTHSQNVFTIDFAVLNYIKSEKNKYAYKLEGFNNDWVYTDIPSAPYTKLSAGNYIFLAKGANNDGIWGQAAILHIQVLPPIWETIWAYCLYVLLIGGLVFLIARFFILRSLLQRDKELTQLKLNFFTNISHEIRTHLSLILGPLEKLVLFGKDDAENTRQLQIVKKSSDSLLQLVNEQMDFRKAESGNLKLHVSEYNIVNILQEILASFYENSISGNITIDLISSSDDTKVYFDKEQLEKVFYNLIYNAFKFTNYGGHIGIFIKENKNEVTITIADNGKGIAPENLKNLFENYFQENDHGKQNTGYGIGLALAKSIVELHQGSIVVESKLSPGGNNTAFTISLRKGADHFNPADLIRSKEDDQSEAVNFAINTDSTITYAQVENKSIGNKKYLVLLVEDNPDMRLFISDFLKNHYEVIIADNGLNGWELAKEHIPDILISDVMMHEMDGFTLCNKLKTDESTNHIPVILLTAKASDSSRVEGLKMGADVYLSKPFSIEILLLQVNNLLTSSERIRQSFNRLLKSVPKSEDIISVQYENNDQKIKKLVDSIDNEFLNKVISIIDRDIDNLEFGVPELTKALAMSKPILYKKLNALTGMSVNDFIKSVRMNKATILLQSKRYTINEIAYMVGFSDRKYFSKEFKKQYGQTPSEFIKEA